MRGTFMSLSECSCFQKTYNLTKGGICEKDMARYVILYGILMYLW